MKKTMFINHKANNKYWHKFFLKDTLTM